MYIKVDNLAMEFTNQIFKYVRNNMKIFITFNKYRYEILNACVMHTAEYQKFKIIIWQLCFIIVEGIYLSYHFEYFNCLS